MNDSAIKRFLAAVAACTLFALTFGNSALAQEHPAQDLVKDAVMEALDVLSEEKEELTTDRALLRQRVDELIVPHVDFNTMTKLAVGKFWRKANADERVELVEQFQMLLLNTYAGALSEYKGQSISFEPFRPQTRDDRAIVRSSFNQSSVSKGVPVIYKLRDRDGWSIYDIEVNSISLVTSYRTAFANEISKGGIPGLLGTLRERNAKKS